MSGQSNTPKKDQVEVLIIESERGWGQRLDERKYFDDEEQAKKFIEKYNKYNDKPQVPDWYMYAVLAKEYYNRSY